MPSYVRWCRAIVARMRSAHAFIVVAVSWSFASCASAPSSPPPPMATRSEVVRPSTDAIYRFDWSPPCRVPVRERTEKRGNTSVMTYMIDLRPSSSGALELHMTDFAFLEVNGQDATEPAIREAIRPALAITAAVPAMAISVEGRYLAVQDFDRMLDTLETVRAQQGASPEELARVRAMMNAPTVRRMLEEQAGQYWRTWVESWLDWSLPPGEAHEEQRVLTVPGGGQGPVTIRTEHLGFVDGKARLRLTNEIRGSALTALIGPALEQLAQEANRDGSPEDVIHDGRRQTVITVETDPATLRPHHTRYEMTVELQFSNGEHHKEREIRDVSWDWGSAVGCGH